MDDGGGGGGEGFEAGKGERVPLCMGCNGISKLRKPGPSDGARNSHWNDGLGLRQ